MEVKVNELQVGQVFYAVTVNCEFPSISKLMAEKVTAKQVIGKSVVSSWGGTLTLRSTSRFFTDFQSAQAAWVESKLDVDIRKAEENLERFRRLKENYLQKTDV